MLGIGVYRGWYQSKIALQALTEYPRVGRALKTLSSSFFWTLLMLNVLVFWDINDVILNMCTTQLHLCALNGCFCNKFTKKCRVQFEIL